MSRENEMQFKVAERFLLHREALRTDNPITREILKKIIEVEMWEMWTLTQK